MKPIYKIVLGLLLVWVFSFLIKITLGTWMILPTFVTGVVFLFCVCFWKEIMEDGTKSKP